MTARAAFACILCLLVPAVAAEPPDDPTKNRPTIEWHDDLEQAMEMSREQGRPVIAYFTFVGCVWCDRLAEACFFEPEVVKQSRRFIWVKVDRDQTPEIPRRFNVSAYPSLLTFGDEYENVFRFHGFKQPNEFLPLLDEALKRFALYKAGQEWFLPETRPERLTEAAKQSTLPAPSEDVPSGVTFLGDSLWVAQQRRLFRLDAATARVTAEFPLDETVIDLTSDGKLLYAASYGWSAGKPIFVIDPATGRTVRQIVTEANRQNRAYSTKGVAWRDGKLYVLAGMEGTIFEVDPADGELGRRIQSPERWLAGLDFDGEHFVAAGRTHIVRLDPETVAVVERLPVNYPLRSIAARAGQYFVMEQPTFGFGPRHESVRVWPRQTMIYRLAPAGD